MGEHSKAEMETINKNSEFREISTTSSWVLLDTSEDAIPEVSEDAQEKCTINPVVETNDCTPVEYKATFSEDVISHISDTKNKSDAESDGISIISEGEFYQNEYDNNSSSDENTGQNFEREELPIFQSECLDQRLEVPKYLYGISNISSSAKENATMTQDHNTDSNIFEETSPKVLAEPVFEKINIEAKKNDEKSATKDLIDSFKIIFKYTGMCFISTVLLAITVSYVSSKLNKECSIDQKKNREDIQEKYFEIIENVLLNEKEKLDNWRATLAKEENKFKEWENKLQEIELKLYGRMKKIDSLERDTKIKSEKGKQIKTKNIDEYNANKSFKDKNGFKKFKTDKRLNVQSSTFDDGKTITGEWYLNLLQGRMEKRAQDKKAGWWFDRANFRNIKRNKAYWYFHYMFNREDLRYHLKSKTKNF